MSDLISRAVAIDAWDKLSKRGRTEFDQVLMTLPSAEVVSREDYHNLLTATDDIDRALREYQAKDENTSAEAEWIPVKTRPMDEEERREWSEKVGYDIEYDEAVIYTSQLPDDGQSVLTCSQYGNITIDTFENDPDYGCGFEENGDMDGIVAWMPLPKPYREENEV